MALGILVIWTESVTFYYCFSDMCVRNDVKSNFYYTNARFMKDNERDSTLKSINYVMSFNLQALALEGSSDPGISES